MACIHILWATKRLEMKKLTTQNGGWVKNENSRNKISHSLQKEEKSQPKHSVKKEAKFEKVVKSTVQPS